MNLAINEEKLGRELPGWALRGVLCAANSAGWAVLMGFQAATEIAGMVAGVAFWVALFAGACAWMPGTTRWNHGEAVAALKWAAWIRIGLTAGAWLVYAAASAAGFHDLGQMALVGTLDTILGLGALLVVSVLAGMKGPESVAAADSFGWTALTTIVEGLLVAGTITGLAVAVWLAWRVAARVGIPARFLPVRTNPGGV